MFRQLDLQKKESGMDLILSESNINIKKLRQFAWCGIPAMYRNKAYRLLLNLCGLKNDEIQSQILELNDFYFKKILMVNMSPTQLSKLNKQEIPQKKESNPDEKKDLTQMKDKKYFSIHEFTIDLDQKTSKQIEMDIERIPEIYMNHKGTNLSFIYKNILKITAKRKPAIGYVQGMADLLIPFIEIYRNEYFAESTIYFAFSGLIDMFSDFYIQQDERVPTQENLVKNEENSQNGINQSINKLEKLLKIIDPELYLHFIKIGLKIHMFAYRWLNCLFVREFKLQYYLIVLDTMLSTSDYKLFIVYFAISVLQSIRENILNKGFEESLLFLQKLNEIDWKYADLNMMFATAYVNVNIFEKKYYFDF